MLFALSPVANNKLSSGENNDNMMNDEIKSFTTLQCTAVFVIKFIIIIIANFNKSYWQVVASGHLLVESSSTYFFFFHHHQQKQSSSTQ